MYERVHVVAIALLAAAVAGCDAQSQTDPAYGADPAPVTTEEPQEGTAESEGNDELPARFEIVEIWHDLAPYHAPMDLNAGGEVLVHSFHGKQVWRPDGTTRSLQVDGEGPFVRRLSDRGFVVGSARMGNCAASDLEAYVWAADGSVALTGNFGSIYRDSQGQDINSGNIAVGIHGFADRCTDGPPPPHVSAFFRWDQAGFVDLGLLGADDGWPLQIRINDQEELAFELLRFGDGGERLYQTYFRDSHGARQPVPDLRLQDLSNGGIVGGCAPAAGAGHLTPALWTATGGTLRLDPEQRPGCVVSLNARATAVGNLDLPGGQVAFLYSKGRLHELQGLVPPHWGGRINTAVAINEVGQVLVDTPQGAAILTPSQETER
jgi:hypothetical protein